MSPLPPLLPGGAGRSRGRYRSAPRGAWRGRGARAGSRGVPGAAGAGGARGCRHVAVPVARVTTPLQRGARGPARRTSRRRGAAWLPGQESPTRRARQRPLPAAIRLPAHRCRRPGAGIGGCPGGGRAADPPSGCSRSAALRGFLGPGLPQLPGVRLSAPPGRILIPPPPPRTAAALQGDEQLPQPGVCSWAQQPGAAPFSPGVPGGAGRRRRSHGAG